jgi:hypothetical protein
MLRRGFQDPRSFLGFFFGLVLRQGIDPVGGWSVGWAKMTTRSNGGQSLDTISLDVGSKE